MQSPSYDALLELAQILRSWRPLLGIIAHPSLVDQLFANVPLSHPIHEPAAPAEARPPTVFGTPVWPRPLTQNGKPVFLPIYDEDDLRVFAERARFELQVYTLDQLDPQDLFRAMARHYYLHSFPDPDDPGLRKVYVYVTGGKPFTMKPIRMDQPASAQPRSRWIDNLEHLFPPGF